MNLKVKVSLFAGVALLSGILTSCNDNLLNCRYTSICPIKDEPNYSLSADFDTPAQEVTVHPGQTVAVKLKLSRTGLSQDAPIIFKRAAGVDGLSDDPSVISVFDLYGRVQVKWDGQPLTGDSAVLTITALPNAAVGKSYAMTTLGPLLSLKGGQYGFLIHGTINVN